MKPYHQIDKWMLDIERELKEGKTKRGPLQRKHMKLMAIRDRLYAKATAGRRVELTIDKYCKERIAPPSPGVPGSAPRPPLPPPLRKG